jgi:hypothetical protein
MNNDERKPFSERAPTEVFIVATRRKSGLPGPEKSVGPLHMTDEAARNHIDTLPDISPSSYGVFRCLITVEEEV